MTEPTPEPIAAMIARVERSYARDPAFVFEADGSPLEKLAYRHVRHLWFAELGRVSARDKGGRPIDPDSLALYDAVCREWEDDGTNPTPDVLRRIGGDVLPGVTFKMLRKRFDAAQRHRHRERFRDLVQSRAEAEVLLRKVADDLVRERAELERREREIASREAAAAEIKAVNGVITDRNFLHTVVHVAENSDSELAEAVRAQARAALSANPKATPNREP